MIHQKKNRGHRTSKIVKSRQSYGIGHLSYHCLFYYLARALMHDAAFEFARAIRIRTNNCLERPKVIDMNSCHTIQTGADPGFFLGGCTTKKWRNIGFIAEYQLY